MLFAFINICVAYPLTDYEENGGYGNSRRERYEFGNGHRQHRLQRRHNGNGNSNAMDPYHFFKHGFEHFHPPIAVVG